MKLRLIYILALMYTLSAHSAELTKQKISVTITVEGKNFLYQDTYNKLLTVSGTLQNDNTEYGIPNTVYFPDIQKPYCEIGHDTQHLQYITDYISTDNTHSYLGTLSLIQLIHLYQNADYWSLDTSILDNLRIYIAEKLQNKDVLNDIFSTQESLDTFLNACNSQTKATIAHLLLPHVRSLFWPLVTEPYQTLTDQTNLISSVAVHAHGTLCSRSYDHTIRIWKKNAQGTYHCVQTFTDNTNHLIYPTAAHSDGTTFLTSGTNKIHVLKPDAQGTYHCMQTLTDHTEWISSVVVHADGTLFSGSGDNTIRVWKKDAQGTYHCVQTLASHSSPISALAVDTDDTLFSGSGDGTICVWKLPTVPLSLEQCLTVLYLYHQYQNNNNQQLAQVSPQAHNVYNTLPSSIKNIVIPWYNPIPLYKKLLVTGVAASIIGAGCYKQKNTFTRMLK
ncbi:hypothetical protein J120_03365 [candidate division TM6 bacterium JCVI TM6SC1]|uniref:Uncharacterized protein n=1 Tax=candidate division TM6 bacterium JCVI TM6SC1 TaxID=1306947 RepID=A0A0D2K519_9BACT|nr:hypothetical protein J120_03365 [candidate division TM6 bacterium JCVI TM6SC1]